MLIVYLDQNQWIQLARVATGRMQSEEVARVLRAMRKARDTAAACFPLSFGHLIETKRRKNLDSSIRLMAVMQELSGGVTLAGDTLSYELDQALFRLFPGRVTEENMTPLSLLGFGWEHADPLNALLMGLFGMEGSETAEASFATGLAELRAPFSEEQRENILYSRAMGSVRDHLIEALNRDGISVSEMTSLGEPKLREFLEDLPSVRLDIHLHRQWAKNRTLRIKRNDAYDLVYVGQALTYCDVVVTEKQLADLVQRDGFECHASVLTNLAELPPVLLGRN